MSEPYIKSLNEEIQSEDERSGNFKFHLEFHSLEMSNHHESERKIGWKVSQRRIFRKSSWSQQNVTNFTSTKNITYPKWEISAIKSTIIVKIHGSSNSLQLVNSPTIRQSDVRIPNSEHERIIMWNITVTAGGIIDNQWPKGTIEKKRLKHFH